MHDKFLKPYDPKETDTRIYSLWEKSEYFNPDKLPARHVKPFTIMIAPPNVTGALHMGHALENTISDIIIRTHRMQGYKTLWVPGTDHAGIATQNVVEKDLKKHGLSRHDLGKDKFLEKVWEWKNTYGDVILGQLKKLGCSLDWSRTRFTMDEKYQEAVKTAFDHYYKKGLIYQGERVINWCIKDQTALSDLELEYAEEAGQLWQIRYPIKGMEKDGDKGFITIATTRPETLLGDTAIAVNPKDDRYKALVGKMVLLPLVDREIPIITDHTIDMEFGTGAVKVTPAHDMADSDIAQRNNIPFLKVINEVGKIINVGPNYDGLKIAEAREKVVAALREKGLVVKEDTFTHNVAKCYRCGSTVEPMLSKQWFLKMKPLAERTITAIKAGDVDYTPDRWEAIALNWLENVRDWCISRQIWWGHKIPAKDPETGKDSEDTFDTWFSSALWPLAALGWPDKDAPDLKAFYPTSVITSARDIVHLWISRMIFSGLEFMDVAPFKDVIIHATVLTKDGKRMSKSLGTGIDPLILIDKYGADATRFGLIYQAFEGQELRFNEDVLAMGKKFANKLWNITRYVESSVKNEAAQKAASNFDLKNVTSPENKKILESLNATITSVTQNIEKFKFGEAAHTVYDFVWHDYADVYIEYSKTAADNTETQAVLEHVLIQSIKLLHPFMPFITEEIWQLMTIHPNKIPTLMIEAWPTVI